MTPPTALWLADWATALEPTPADLALAEAALLDTVAVGLAARDEPILRRVGELGEAGRWAVACHILDFDDLHMPSTTHISTVCVPATLAAGGGPRAYLAGAGVMARLGAALGWNHYSSGWHATSTTGAVAAAVCAAVARSLDADATARAIALAVSASGGVQRAFGTDAKSVQVGLAVDAGMRAAALAESGVTADPRALDEWMHLVGATTTVTTAAREAIPGGLAVKMYPCCYALQRPIEAMRGLVKDAAFQASDIRAIRLKTPKATVQPLIHDRPQTGLEGKFSMQYALAAGAMDSYPGFDSFTDESVLRPEAQRLVEIVEITLEGEGDGLLFGSAELEVITVDGATHRAVIENPLGSPANPIDREGLSDKARECLRDVELDPVDLAWENAADILRRTLA